MKHLGFWIYEEGILANRKKINRNQIMENSQSSENLMSTMFRLGAVTTVIALAGILVDIVFGMSSGGDLSALPQTAIGRFAEFRDNK
jgi:hypothetical protein